jgi:hypothetical protein
MTAGDPAGATTSAGPVEVLARGVASYLPYLQDSGELHDPVFGEPTQYGTAYQAYCHAVLADAGPPGDRGLHLRHATSGLDAALSHTANPALTPTASSFARDTGATRRGNHRDFTWPPILKTYRVLAAAGSPRAAEFADRIARVDIEQSFRSRPPSNWASVWLSGEWIRIREGLSPHSTKNVDEWLAVFLDDLVRPDDGFYFEPGKPNSYDLFTRWHLADLLAEGYDGRWQDELDRLMVNGFRRSLDVQLSDGSLASAHRSAGQTWTVGAQVAYFTRAARYFTERADQANVELAEQAASRAFASMRRWQRVGAPFSPVENLLPAGYRVGYETYTADAHYGSLALALLAAAVAAGFTGATPVPAERQPAGRAEHDPIFRGVAHAGRYSVAVNADPAPKYDAFGITDVTFGPGRYLQFASSVRHPETGSFVNLGMARRPEAGRSQLDIMAQRAFTLTEPIHAVEKAGLRLTASSDDLTYELEVSADADGISVEERTPGLADHRTLLVPYLRDAGTGEQTTTSQTATGVRLTLGAEEIEIVVDQPVEWILDLPYGFENRRGLCGLVRIDLRDPTDRISYRVRVVR